MSSDEKKNEQKEETFAFSFLGDTLVTKDGTVKTAEHLKGKSHVMIYFSAHWCPPCRGFTPKLAKWYSEFIKSDKGKKTEVIFQSWDKNEDKFKSYFKEMPWVALPYKQVKLDSWGIGGIPTLVVLGPDGKIITKKGRAGVSEDIELGSKGEKFPWIPQPISEISGDVNAAASLIVLFKDDKDLAEGKEAYTEIAVDFKAKGVELQFFYATKSNEQMYEQLKSLFTMEDNEMVIANIPNRERFLFKKGKDRELESIKAFVNAYVEKTDDLLDRSSLG
jgi:nucleoredoxin